MRTSLCLPLCMQLAKVVRIFGQQSVAVLSSVLEVVAVIPTSCASGARCYNLVPRLLQEGHQQVFVRAVVEVDGEGHGIPD